MQAVQRGRGQARQVRVEDFGLMDALHAMTDLDVKSWQDGVPEEVLGQTRSSDRGFGSEWMRSLVLPASFLFRDLTVGTASAGGNLAGRVKTMHAGALDDYSVLAEAGMRVIPFSVGEVPSIPAVDAAVIAGVAPSEGGDVPTDGATFRAVNAVMSTIGVSVNVSRRLMIQAGRAGRDFIMNEIARAVGRELDRLVLCGSGTAGEFAGLFTIQATTPSPAAQTFEWGHAIDQLALLLASGVREQDVRWIGSPFVRQVLSKRHVVLTNYTSGLTTGPLVAQTVDRPIWDGRSIAGLPALVANECHPSGLIAADFTKIVVGIQDITLIVDARVGTAGTHRLTMLMDASMVAPQPGCFRASTGIQ